MIIVTRGHRDDMRVLKLAIATPARYIAMIGSKRKVLNVIRELEKEGVAARRVRADLRAHGPGYRRHFAGGDRHFGGGGNDRRAPQRRFQLALAFACRYSPANRSRPCSPSDAAGLILAAGESRRMGSPKALLRYREETFLERLIGLFAAALLARDRGAGRARGRNPRARRAPRHLRGQSRLARGQTSSMQCGLRAVPAGGRGRAVHPGGSSGGGARHASTRCSPGPAPPGPRPLAPHAPLSAAAAATPSGFPASSSPNSWRCRDARRPRRGPRHAARNRVPGSRRPRHRGRYRRSRRLPAPDRSRRMKLRLGRAVQGGRRAAAAAAGRRSRGARTSTPTSTANGCGPRSSAPWAAAWNSAKCTSACSRARFTVEDVIIHEDPSIGLEPIAYMDSVSMGPPGHLVAARRPFVIASIGWTAPASTWPRRARPRSGAAGISLPSSTLGDARHPGIHVRNGRINFKFGDKKTRLLPARNRPRYLPARLRRPRLDAGLLRPSLRAPTVRRRPGRFHLARPLVRGARARGSRSGTGPRRAWARSARCSRARPAASTARFDLAPAPGRPHQQDRHRGPLDIEDVHRWDLLPATGRAGRSTSAAGWTCCASSSNCNPPPPPMRRCRFGSASAPATIFRSRTGRWP